MDFQEQIVKLFLFHKKLKFNEIEKLVKIRSNKIDYHLKKLVKKGVIIKENKDYHLSESSESLIPYLSEKNAVLPVILIKIGNNKQTFLYKREKRPYQGKLSLPGGRMILGEDISKAVTRIMKEKYNLNAKLKRIDSLSIEHLIKNKQIVNTFLLILVIAETKEKIELTNTFEKRKEIIASDYSLLTKKSSNLKINTILSRIE